MSKIFFLGAGKMASAIAGGLVSNRLFQANELAAFDVLPAAGAAFTAATGIACVELDAVKQAECLLLAVKPQMLESALSAIRKLDENGKSVLEGKLVISIAAGVGIEKIAALTGQQRIIRVMPNTPALVGCGASAFAPGSGALPEDIELCRRILDAVGLSMQVKEADLDGVTGLSGSGPAYVFEFIQALADGGVAEGLPRDAALKLAAQTLLGAAEMVLKTGKHPNELCDAVTSPGGTTSRGLEVLASHAFHGVVMQAVRAAAARSRELGAK